MRSQSPNQALQRTRRGRRGCHRRLPCAGPLSLGRYAALVSGEDVIVN
jgi:hypothetical protein